METLKNLTFSEERALYNVHNLRLYNCQFQGIEDGESALKEASNIVLEKVLMDLRYPLWHNNEVKLNDVTMTSNCRAALWYTTNANITNSKLYGIKVVRECDGVNILNTDIISPEFGWKSNNIVLKDTSLNSEYAFLDSKNITLKNVQFQGKYSFQYVENLIIEDSILNTKDAFWHSKNVIVKNSTISGEYLGWYSENLTFINCKIIGTQPLCYCKSLELIDCTMENCDLSFEYSEVNATIKGTVDSIKNPLSGTIVVNNVKEIIMTDDTKYPCKGKVILD